jgi:hypothetical protein
MVLYAPDKEVFPFECEMWTDHSYEEYETFDHVNFFKIFYLSKFD